VNHAPSREITISLFLRIVVLLAVAIASAWAAPAPVTVVTIEGAIGPASADYASRGIARAATEGSQLVILRIDTPGGLDTSMRAIIKAILTSPVPVATYVAPSGARAASAGTYILYASHIAAMAPGTNIGAATPVQVGGAPQQPERPGEPAKEDGKSRPAEGSKSPEDATTTPMTRKQINDAAAYIRGLAQMRGRNAEWAERAVREAVSLSANEAQQQRVVEYVARDVPDLLRQLDKKRVGVLGRDQVLQTAEAPIVEYEADWRVRLLAAITDPSIALLLMTIGIYGLIFEFTNPGVGVAGVLGGICLLLALYALQLLPVNYAGLGLILLGIGFMVTEAFLPSFGVLGLGGIVAFVVGALILIDTELPGFGIPVALIVSIAVASALVIVTLVAIALKTRRLAAAGPSNMIGSLGEALEDIQQEGWAKVHGENWRVASRTPLHRAQQVRVVGRKGLLLEVEAIDNQEKGE
jgi:membrane-bound serine protease (ClpP class)